MLESGERLRLEETNLMLRIFVSGGHTERCLLYDTTERDVLVV